MFNWQTATITELADYIAVVSSALVQSQIKHYAAKGDNEMLTKIVAARKLAVAVRLQNKAAKVLAEIKRTTGGDQDGVVCSQGNVGDD